MSVTYFSQSQHSAFPRIAERIFWYFFAEEYSWSLLKAYQKSLPAFGNNLINYYLKTVVFSIRKLYDNTSARAD